MLLKIFRRARSIICFSLWLARALLATDLIAKFKVLKTPPTSLHSLISLNFSVIAIHRVYIFFWLPMVTFIIWITALFLVACPNSNWFLKAPKALDRVLFKNLFKPISNLLPFTLAAWSLLSGKFFHLSHPLNTFPILVLTKIIRIPFSISFFFWSCS